MFLTLEQYYHYYHSHHAKKHSSGDANGGSGGSVHGTSVSQTFLEEEDLLLLAEELDLHQQKVMELEQRVGQSQRSNYIPGTHKDGTRKNKCSQKAHLEQKPMLQKFHLI